MNVLNQIGHLMMTSENVSAIVKQNKPFAIAKPEIKPVNKPEPEPKPTIAIEAIEPPAPVVQKDATLSHTMTLPRSCDVLFWFYKVIEKDDMDYYSSCDHHYKMEQTEKIGIIEKVKDNKAKLKSLRIKQSIVDEILGYNFTIDVFRAICRFFDLPVAIKRGNMIEVVDSNEDNIAPIDKLIDVTNKSGYTISRITNYTKLMETHLVVGDIMRPFKSKSAYTVGELKDIINKLEPEKLQTPNKYKKDDLYEIVSKYN